MICVKTLVRHVETGEHSRALSRVLGNGRSFERDLQNWLGRNPRELPTIAIGFTLMRLAELTYGPTGEGSRLAERLLAEQHEDGGFGYRGFSPVTTAAALTGLLFHADQYRQVSEEPDVTVTLAIDRASRALTDWIVEQRASEAHVEELALVRRQFEAMAVLGITADDMLHEACAVHELENEDANATRTLAA